MSEFSKEFSKIVVLTGAGISSESGIRTFRDSNGLWEEHPIEEVATPEGFFKNPALVYDFYNQRRRQLLSPEVQPNRAHYAVAELERNFSGDFLLVTQNVDDLHERAGNKNIIHIHGELKKARCMDSGKLYPLDGDLTCDNLCICCEPAIKLRPHIVWFGEMPLEMGFILEALQECDLFISIGTSGNVYPAAGFVEYAKLAGAKTVELNLEPSLHNSAFEEKYYGLATEIVPKFVETISRLFPWQHGSDTN